MRDNETILQLIGDTESFVRSRMVAVIEADASPDTIGGFVACLQALQSAANCMGDRRFDNPDGVYAIAREAVAPIEKSLIQLTERIERSLGEGDRP